MKDVAQRINKVVQALPPSGIRRFFELVLGTPGVISLGVGEPDFATPWRITEAAVYSLEKGYTSYTSNQGLLELRQEIAKEIQARTGVSYDPYTEILITVGVSEGLDLSCRTLLNPGEGMIVIDPAFVSYAALVTVAGGIPQTVNLRPHEGFRLAVEDLEAAVDQRTKALLVNFPHNPTGQTLSRAEQEEVAAFVRRHDLLLITDDIYRMLSYDEEHTSFINLPGMRERTVLLDGFSKAYAMTGWRIGYVAAPAPLVAAMNKLHQYTLMCAPIMSQMAAIEALRNGQEEVERMRREFHRRRNLVQQRFAEMGLPCIPMAGAFYAFPDISSVGLSSEEFAEQLLVEEKVAVVPGTAFGEIGKGFVRCAYATSTEKLEIALNRIESFVGRHRQPASAPAVSAGERL